MPRMGGSEEGNWDILYSVNIYGNTAYYNDPLGVYNEDYNSFFGYLFAHGRGYIKYDHGKKDSLWRAYQVLLWSRWKFWCSEVGEKLGITTKLFTTQTIEGSVAVDDFSGYESVSKNYVAEVSRYIKEDILPLARQYREEMKTGTTATISSSASKIKYSGDAIPITLTFTGTIYEIYFDTNKGNGKEIDTLGDYLYLSSDQAGNNKISKSEISSGSKFYVQTKNGCVVTGVSFYTKMSKNITIYDVNLKLLHSSSGNQNKLFTESKTITETGTSTASIYIYIEKATGKLIIKKTGKTENLAGAAFKIYCSSNGYWVSGSATGTKSFVTSEESASSYTTGSDGSITITLYAGYTYMLVETSLDNPYYNDPINIMSASSDKGGTLSISGTSTSKTKVSGVYIYDNASVTNTVTIKDEKNSGDITIKKVDEDFNSLTLSGAKIKLYRKDKGGWVQQLSSNKYSYTASASNATVFTTNSSGLAEIKCLKFGTYDIYETATPEGYDITKQEGYMADSISKTNKWVFLGEVNLTYTNDVITYNATNLKIANEITGFVWVDAPHDKSNTIDHIYTGSGDELKAGVPVELVNSSGNTIASTQTGSDGKYSFKYSEKPSAQNEYNLNYWELAHCYVRFIYDNAGEHDERGEVLNENYGYIVVDPFQGGTSQSSKAQEYTVTQAKLDDSKLTGTKGTNRGEAVTYKDGVANNYNTILSNKDILTYYFNRYNYTIEYINLGLAEKNDPTYSVDETLEYIKVTMNGYEYTYNYGDNDKFSDEDPAKLDYPGIPEASKQTSSRTFTASVYPSDVQYNSMNEGALKVYVVYKISVTNDEKTALSYLYNEQKLYLESLENRFDANRYELCTDKDVVDEDREEIRESIANWDEPEGSYYTNNGKKYTYFKTSYNVSDDSDLSTGIASNETKSTYVQYKITDNALNSMLSDELTYDAIEKYPSISYARAYHEYLRTDNIWTTPGVRSYTGATSTKGKDTTYTSKTEKNKNYFVHKSVVKERHSGEFYINLKFGAERKISGTVFEDHIEDDDTNLGDGIRDVENDNVVNNVKVELLDKDGITTSYLYTTDGYDDAITYTNESGGYSLSGVVPGYYYIRFTYSDDDSQEIYDLSGKKIDDVYVRDYKSTIITNSYIKNAMEAKDDSYVYWYKDIKYDSNEENYSTAVDDLKEREDISDEYEINGSLEYITMPAYTPETGISIECDKEDDCDNNGTKYDGTHHYNVFGGFNLGIIKVPDIKTSLYKEITNVALKTQIGNYILSANPYGGNSIYLSDLSDINVLTASGIGGSNYAKLEIDPSYIQGANFEVTYTIKVKNESDIDYDNVEYYKYGSGDGGVYKINPTKIAVTLADKLDSKYQTIDTSQIVTSSKIDESGTANNGAVEINFASDTASGDYQEFKIINWDSLLRNESETVTYNVSAQLSTNDDTLFSNGAQIVKLTLTNSSDQPSLATLQKTYEWSQNNALITITPSTGADRTNTYWIVGAIALVVLATGIVVLKKKVLK